MSVLEVLEAATDFLRKRGIENPRLNAQHLLASVLKCRRIDLYLLFDRPVSEAERAPLRDLVRRRAAGEPLQHLLGEWDFYSRTFLTDARALVPRPETELLVEEMLRVLPNGEALAVADVGTGSGAIGITLALERPAWSVTATDLSTDALALARANAERLSCGNIVFRSCDLLPAGSGPFHAIAANLPYIPAADLPGLPPEVRHDPAMALDGGSDGLEIIRRLVALSPDFLIPGGWLFLEFGDGQAEAVREILSTAGSGALNGITIHKDLAGLPRFASARGGINS